MELLLIVISALVLLGIFATDLGVDSRDGSDDPHRPVYPVGIG